MFRQERRGSGGRRRASRRRVAAVGIALLAAGCAAPKAARSTDDAGAGGDREWHSTLDVDHPLVGRIWDVRRGVFVERAELEAALAGARFPLLGEIHDNTDHHRLQAEMITALIERGRRPALVLEMIGRRRQAALDRALREHPDDPDAIARAVEWSESGWPSFEMYRPIFAAALAGGLPMRAAGLEREETRAVIDGDPGAVPERVVARYGLDRPLDPKTHQAVLQEMIDGHCGHLPESMAEPMVRVQRVRDALLADALESGATADGAVLVAGNGHVRTDRGVPALLGERGPWVALALAEVQADLREPGDYATQYDVAVLPFDYVWFTPRDNDIDYCAELEKQLESKSEGGAEATEATQP